MQIRTDLYPRFCQTLCCPTPKSGYPGLYCHLSRPTKMGRQVVACRVLPSLARPAATRSHLGGCPQRDPLALLPVARSPSRNHHWPRWWAFTPPFHPLPAHTQSGSAAGILSVAVVVKCPLPDIRPHLRFRGATSPPTKAERESGSSSTGSHRQRQLPSVLYLPC